jgi:hypothetical protein
VSRTQSGYNHCTNISRAAIAHYLHLPSNSLARSLRYGHFVSCSANCADTLNIERIHHG